MHPTPTHLSPTWLDAQYNNRARIADHAAIFARWAIDSQQVRETRACRLDLTYGDGPNESLDLFLPTSERAPVLVFIHGGYWRALDKSDQSFVASGLVDDGALVVIPNYALCPAVTMETIALQCARALAWVWRNAARFGGDPARIVVAGHSAGGHLAVMLLCCDWHAVGSDLPRDLVTSAQAISGLFDLEPLRHTPFLQTDLRLTPSSVRRLSPAGFSVPARRQLHAWVGALESEEFLRQNGLLRERWGSATVPVCAQVPGAHHLSVLDSMVSQGGDLRRDACLLLGL